MKTASIKVYISLKSVCKPQRNVQNILHVCSLQMHPKSFQETLSLSSLSKNDLPNQKKHLLLELMSQHMGKGLRLNVLLSSYLFKRHLYI